jgi:hypothetical protein
MGLGQAVEKKEGIMNEYVIVRRWQTRKRTYQIAVGPYPTRYRAQRKIEEYISEWGYWNDRDQFTVALYRRPEYTEHLQEVV